MAQASIKVGMIAEETGALSFMGRANANVARMVVDQINTDGGLLSNSHNAQPSGMHTIEVVRQLRGECGPRQVVGAKIGLSFAQGNAVHGHAGTLVMAVD